MMKARWTVRALALAACATAAIAQPLAAQDRPAPLQLGEGEIYRAPGVDWLVFSNWYDGLFADAKISGVELIQQGERIATNGDVRLSSTPGQWDAIGRLVERRVDTKTGVIEAELEYPDHKFRYLIRSVPTDRGLQVTVSLPQALPAALAGRAGFNLEFQPSAYYHEAFLVDGKPGGFPLYPASEMTLTPERNAASGRADGPGAEPVAMAMGKRFVLAPSNPGRRVSVTSDVPVSLYDGRNQAQNGWFVLRSLLPAGKTGTVMTWTLDANSVPGWLRAPVIGHSQLGYAPGETKIATVERDANDRSAGAVRLLRVGEDGRETVALQGAGKPWGDYLRYRYAKFDFSSVRTPGVYVLETGKTRTAPFRIADDLYASAWHPTLDIYFPVAMDHMFVNEAYRVWHGDPHRDDALQAPVNHEHIDLYRQGPTTDTKFQPGEHIPGLNVGGWLDAGDFDIRTQTQYAVIRQMVQSWEDFRPTRDTTSIDQERRHVEIHVPDGKPDLLQQIRHGSLQLIAQFDAVGHAIHGIVEPDVAQYTHLGDAVTKTDGLVHDWRLKPGEVKNGRSGTPDDRWAFTSKASALNYGSIAALAATARALKGFDDDLAARSLETAERIFAKEQAQAPDTFSHGNTTGGPLESERFAAAVELLQATRKPVYAEAVAREWPAIAPNFARDADVAVRALPFMPASYRAGVEQAVRGWAKQSEVIAAANPYGVPITTGGWAGNGAVLDYGNTTYLLHRAFPEIVKPDAVFRALAYLHGNHPGSDISFVSGVGTRSKEVAYGNNRADMSFIAGGVVPGVLIVKPDLPENKEDWPYFWGQNEYVVNTGAAYLQLVHAAHALTQQGTKPAG
ncbi:glycoside hydrolase family 9 protein [Sphingomonas qomolangmaensis]|uniref:Glycoside hydrolase family 9 protein n=1 Tax=Sphingomonas qomolangmaensis TaxID=2918765 RepID=A0ABY5L9T2_9SPHN|nr:glycoside hydrolase family 9 protein [Sphingomonas qomolangmaensis]UUL82353.1 glycoside hydrolase family 9 protein [Sphingomonas qomolangmaensis]